MKWVPDRTGRFRQRPHYEPLELDEECERIVVAFLEQRYGAVRYPLTTNDLSVMLERDCVLDPYADLTEEGEGVEGVTYFAPGGGPEVRIASDLTTDVRRENRLRTTLTHEYGHVRFHQFLYGLEAESLPLFAGANGGRGPRCKRESIVAARASDWMEWQAAHACGAFLMPATAVHALMRRELGGAAVPVAESEAGTLRLVHAVREHFLASADAVRVRLTKLGYIRAPEALPLIVG